MKLKTFLSSHYDVTTDRSGQTRVKPDAKTWATHLGMADPMHRKGDRASRVPEGGYAVLAEQMQQKDDAGTARLREREDALVEVVGST